MRGYCKCDLCGSVYHEDENKMYNGITVWWKSESGVTCFPGDKKLCTPDGEHVTDIPGMLDVCPECQERFYNWIRMTKNNSDFPMNPPE